MSYHIKYPSIGQFRQLRREIEGKTQYLGRGNEGEPVFDPTIPLPTLTLEGTVKLHGTNAAIVRDPMTDEVWFQSRSNVITPSNDNSGFATYFADKEVRTLFGNIPNPKNEVVAIFGEWCGKGIQQGVAISQLPRLFIPFSVKVGDTWLYDFEVFDKEMRVFDIFIFGVYFVVIDFNDPDVTPLTRVVDRVEAECPVAKYFGVTGVGEGLVWRVTETGYEDPAFWCKTKGEKHAVTRTDEPIPVNPEFQESLERFAVNTVTEARCLQALSTLERPVSMSSLGPFLKWIYNDIAKEEADVAEVSGFTVKDANRHITANAKAWFMNAFNRLGDQP